MSILNKAEYLKISTIIKLSHNGLWIEIFKYLSFEDVFKLKQVNKKFKQVVKNTINSYLLIKKKARKDLLEQINIAEASLPSKNKNLFLERYNDVKELDKLLSDQSLLGKEILDMMKYPQQPLIFQQVMLAYYYLIQSKSEILKSKGVNFASCKLAFKDPKFKTKIKDLIKDNIPKENVAKIEEQIQNITIEQVDKVNNQLVKIFNILVLVIVNDMINSDKHARIFVDLMAQEKQISILITLAEEKEGKKLIIPNTMNNGLWNNIIEYLTIPSILSLRQVNKKFKSIIEQTMDYIIKSHKIILDSIIEKKKLNYLNSDDESHRERLTEIHRAVQNLTKSDIVEINSMRNPPMAVQLTFKALAHLMYQPRDLKILLKGKNAGLFHKIVCEGSGLLERLLNFDIDNINETQLVKFDQIIEENHLNPEMIRSTSKSCHSIFTWAMNIRQYRQMKYSPKQPKEYYDLLNEEKKIKAFINFFEKINYD